MDKRKAIFTVSQCFNSSSIMRREKKYSQSCGIITTTIHFKSCCSNSIYKYVQLRITELDSGSVPTNSEDDEIKEKKLKNGSNQITVGLSFFL